MQNITDYFSTLIPLDTPEIELLERVVQRKKFARKQLLLSIGERCGFVGFIEEGVVRHCTIDEAGNERTCDINIEGNWVTDAKSFAAGVPSQYNLQALKPSHIAFLSHNALEQMYAAFPKFQAISRMINERIVLRLGEISEMLLLPTPEERYKRFFHYNRIIFDQVPRKDIAHLIGIAPESLSRMTKRLYEEETQKKLTQKKQTRKS